MEDIMDKIFEGNKNNIHQIITVVDDKPHNFLFFNTVSQRMFENWDETLMSDNI